MTNRESQRAETQALERALVEAHIPFRRIHHRSGGGRDWLNIRLFPLATYEDMQSVLSIAKAVTGRTDKAAEAIFVYGRQYE